MLNFTIRLKTLLPFLLLTCLLWSCSEDPQNSTATDQSATDPEIPTEEGFYADYEGTNRVSWQKPDLVISLLGDLENKVVADIGAGTGHFSRRLVTKAQKVIAVDIDKRFIHFLDSIRLRELPENYRDRLETRLASPDSPGLRPDEVDAALIVNTFMYIENRRQYLENLAPAIRPGGKVLIVDFKNKRTPVGPPRTIRLPADSVVVALEDAGYRNIQRDDSTLQYQYIVMAEK